MQGIICQQYTAAPDFFAAICTFTATYLAGRMASVQPTPGGGDGFSTPVVHNSQQSKPQLKTVLEEMRASALAVHATTANKRADMPSVNLTDNLLNF